MAIVLITCSAGQEDPERAILPFIASGGSIRTCAAYRAPRGITDADMIAGARIMTAANDVGQATVGALSIWQGMSWRSL